MTNRTRVIATTASGNHPPDQFRQVDPNGPRIFEAVEQQLGLKLDCSPERRPARCFLCSR
jgi:hypothetical protein